jgi:hypothetical protein
MAFDLVNRRRRLKSDFGQFRAFSEAMVTNDTDRSWNLQRTKLDAIGEAIAGETFHTTFRIESESDQCEISQETSTEQSREIAINTKSVRRAVILNQFATVSQKQAIVFHAKVGAIRGKITRNMLGVFENSLVDDFNGGRKDN